MLRILLLERHLTHTQTAFYAALAYMMFSISDAFAKWLMADGFAMQTIIVLNSLPSLIILSLWMAKRRGLSLAWHTPYKLLHILRGLTLAAITFCMFNAVSRLQLADYYGVIFATPLVTTAMAFFVFNERTSWIEWLIIIIGFSGVMMVVKPDYDAFNIGYFFAMGAVFFVSVAGMLVRKIGREEDPYLFVIFGSLALVLVYAIPATQIGLPDDVSWIHWLVIALYSFSIPTAVLTMSAVFARAPTVAAIMPFQYTQIIWGGIIGYLVFGDIPQTNTIIGSGIVIACGLYIIFHHKRKRS